MEGLDMAVTEVVANQDLLQEATKELGGTSAWNKLGPLEGTLVLLGFLAFLLLLCICMLWLNKCSKRRGSYRLAQ